ncbi:MAG: N-acetyltransferase [Thermodesulfobacteriota bacterium]
MLRKAVIQDIKAIHRLLQEYGNRGDLLPRPLSQLYDHLRDFTVATDKTGDDKIIGCCALQFCWEDLAEIRSLAVHPDHLKKGIGTLLVRNAIAEAKLYKIRKVFTLTYRPEFFEQFGFQKIDRADLPYKIWGDCILCVKFPDCDETAMMHLIEGSG